MAASWDKIADGINLAKSMKPVRALRRSSFVSEYNYPPTPKEPSCPIFYELKSGNQCLYDCQYCYLQYTYRFKPETKFFINYDKMYQDIDVSLTNSRTKYFDVGEVLDSLALDPLTNLSKQLVQYFAETGARKNAYLLLLTKSANVRNLLKLDHQGRTFVSWSLNCEYLIRAIESSTFRKTPPLEARLEAARHCEESGYPTRIRFDTLIPIENWEQHYEAMVDQVYREIRPLRVILGSYRFFPGLQKIIEKRFPNSLLLRIPTEKRLDRDGKRRILFELRIRLYEKMIEWIRNYDKHVPISLCHETLEAWERLNLKGCKCDFAWHCLDSPSNSKIWLKCHNS